MDQRAAGRTPGKALATLVLLVLLLAAPVVRADEAASDGVVEEPAAPDTMDTGEPEALDIVVEHGTLSVDLQEAVLRAVAESVFEQTAVEIVFIEDTNAELTVTDEFEDLPLEEGLRRLLAGFNFVPVYAQEREPSDAEPVLVRVMVLPSAEGEPEAVADETAKMLGQPGQRTIPPEVFENMPQASEIAAALREAIGDSLETVEDDEIAGVLEKLMQHDLTGMMEAAETGDPGGSPLEQLEALTDQLETQLQNIGAGEGQQGVMPVPGSGNGQVTE